MSRRLAVDRPDDRPRLVVTMPLGPAGSSPTRVTTPL